MIFVLVAGTYTPMMLLAAPRSLGVAVLGVVWAFALAGLILRMVWLDAPERLVGAVYLGLGWLGAITLPAIWPHVGPLTAGAPSLRSSPGIAASVRANRRAGGQGEAEPVGRRERYCPVAKNGWLCPGGTTRRSQPAGP
jgi:hypothetical protein